MVTVQHNFHLVYTLLMLMDIELIGQITEKFLQEFDDQMLVENQLASKLALEMTALGKFLSAA